MSNTEWIYFFEEPVRHKGLIEIGRTGRTVEARNRDKRSVDPWLEINRYPVVDSRKAETEIIKATTQHRYKKRKEILQIDWPTLKHIVEPILKRNEQFQVMIDNMMEQWFKEFKEQVALNPELQDQRYNFIHKPHNEGRRSIESRFEQECRKYRVDPRVFTERPEGDLGDRVIGNPAGFILTGGLIGMLTVGPLLNWAGTKMKEKKLKVARERLAHAVEMRDRDLKDLDRERDRRENIANRGLEIQAVDQHIKTSKFVDKIKKDAGATVMDTEEDKIKAAIMWKNRNLKYWSRGGLTMDDYISIKKSPHS